MILHQFILEFVRINKYISGIFMELKYCDKHPQLFKFESMMAALEAQDVVVGRKETWTKIPEPEVGKDEDAKEAVGDVFTAASNQLKANIMYFDHMTTVRKVTEPEQGLS